MTPPLFGRCLFEVIWHRAVSLWGYMTPGGVFAGLFDTGAVSLLGYLTPGRCLCWAIWHRPFFSLFFWLFFTNIVTTPTYHKAKSTYTVVGFNIKKDFAYHHTPPHRNSTVASRSPYGNIYWSQPNIIWTAIIIRTTAKTYTTTSTITITTTSSAKPQLQLSWLT